jgi:hypothetical protein
MTRGNVTTSQTRGTRGNWQPKAAAVAAMQQSTKKKAGLDVFVSQQEVVARRLTWWRTRQQCQFPELAQRLIDSSFVQVEIHHTLKIAKDIQWNSFVCITIY